MEELNQSKRTKQEKKLAKLEKYLAKSKLAPITTRKDKKQIVFESVQEIPEGEFKTVKSLNGQFNPLSAENGWFSWWQKQQFFTPEKSKTKLQKGKTFTIVLPPPNVTGNLHLGHAMMASIQDAIVRTKRMQGYTTLYLPGTDHAGIATQVVVEKSLAKQNTTRHQLGREQFLNKVWEWKNAYGNQITNQFKRLGTSLDFTREKFTMDPDLSEAVTEAFIRFHKQGLIYRANRLVNWCSKIQTAISDLEVDHIQIAPYTQIPTDGSKFTFGVLYTIEYEIHNEDNTTAGTVHVSTTRPETIFGDVALCANPNDTRYLKFKNKYPINPITKQKMKFIYDTAADMDFGTGVLKITPAHDPIDFEIGKNHNLKTISILDKNNNLTTGPFQGQNRFIARKNTIELLKQNKSLIKTEGHNTTIPVCSRTGEVLEPRIIPQWWMNCKSLAQQALHATETKQLTIIPPEMNKTWHNWLSNINDWCLSRQLWWGHQIPAYHDNNNNWYVAKTKQQAEQQAGKTLTQDEDVLDTWFSSGLWPFATLGWPNQTQDMNKYYPTQLLETGKDIVFFWVARMVMMGIALTQQLPFNTILFHTIVRDAKGEKMSKSKGNVIDPIDVIQGTTLQQLLQRLTQGNLSTEEINKAKESITKEYPKGIESCGADALRFGLLTNATPGKDVNLSIDKVTSCRRFCNKIWNAMKFTLAQTATDATVTDSNATTATDSNTNATEHNERNSNSNTAIDNWIKEQFEQTVRIVNNAMEEYNFMKATTEIHQFLICTFCDFYIELFKGRKDTEGIRTLRNISLEFIKLAHPFLPFITEEIYQAMKYNWPNPKEYLLNSHWMDSITLEAYPATERNNATSTIATGTNATERNEQTNPIEEIITLVKAVRSDTATNTYSTLRIQRTKTLLDQILIGMQLPLERLTGLKVSLEELPLNNAVILSSGVISYCLE